jgi:methionyl-tRNA formyltransferase
MRIFFIGTVQFSHDALDKLISSDADIVGVATKASSSFNADYADLATLCIKNDIPYKYVNDINHPGNIDFIKKCAPDVIYCFGWSSLIKKDILNLTKLGVVGFHPAALPHNKGRHPIIWALALGLTETASSFFIMDEEADNGKIISQEILKIDYEDDAASLYRKITSVALEQISSFTRALENEGVFTNLKDNGEGNAWRKRSKPDGRIDFRMTNRMIYNLVRALSKPYVGAHLETINGDVKIWKVKEEGNEYNNIEPGKVLSVDNNNILVKTADAAIWLTEHTFGNQLPKINDYFI